MEEIDLNKLEREAEEELQEKLNTQEEALVFDEIQRVEVTNLPEPQKIPEPKEVDLSTVESTLKTIVSKLDSKKDVDLTALEQRLTQILLAVDKEVEEREEINYTDILTAVQNAIPSSFDYDEYFERLEEHLGKINISKEIREGLKGFHSSGWLPVVQAINDLETTVTTTGSAIKAADSASIDAFGRWRVSEPETLFDSKQIHDNQPAFWDDQEISGGGTTSTHSTDTASSTLGVGATTAGRRCRQTYMRFNYQPGKSQLILCTGVLKKTGGGTGITRSFGYYDDENGLFLKDNEGTIQLVRRTYTSGSAVDNAVDQSSWNVDVFDGTGPSGVTLDFTKTQILLIDFEWLGVGRVRMGFVVDGKIYYAHEILNANNLSTVYMSTPNLPIRYEIENDGNGAASTLEHICSSVASEGGQQQNGVLRHASSDEITLTTAHTSYVILAGRLQAGYKGVTIHVENVSALVESNGSGHWEFVGGGTLSAGTLSFVDQANTSVQIAKGDGTHIHSSNGVPIDGGYITGEFSLQFTTPNADHLGFTIAGVPQIWYLIFYPHSNNTDIEMSVTWRELL